jgi:hypothetical protein
VRRCHIRERFSTINFLSHKNRIKKRKISLHAVMDETLQCEFDGRAQDSSRAGETANANRRIKREPGAGGALASFYWP